MLLSLLSSLLGRVFRGLSEEPFRDGSNSDDPRPAALLSGAVHFPTIIDGAQPDYA